MKYLQRDRAFGTEHPLVVLHTLLTCIDQLRVEVSHGASYMHGTLTCIDQLRVEVAMELATCMDTLFKACSYTWFIPYALEVPADNSC